MGAWVLAAIGYGLAAATAAAAASSTTPQYFQTSPELYAGPTQTGQPAFLAQTNPAPFPSISYIPPDPLETQEPIHGAPKNGNIFTNMANLTPYRPHPVGYGVAEHPIPEGAEIVQLHMLHRHGARYPTVTSSVVQKLEDNKFHATGKLGFLNSWKYKLGRHMLVPIGKQELFDSGVQHQYLYGHLYPNNGSKIVVRSTTQDRMTQSAEYFLAGFFGLEWPRNASLELIIEKLGYNNSLAGYFKCPNSQQDASHTGRAAAANWTSSYLRAAHTRLNKQLTFADADLELSISDISSFQSLCAYETVALGYSAFCALFTFEEWQGYEYAMALHFAGDYAFQSPTARGVGIGWVQELRARLQHHYLTTDTANANRTLDSMPETFPLDQSLYLDFSHDTNIMAILTAMGLTQFNAFLPATHIVPRELVVSRLEPFASRLDIEIISAPAPVPASRASSMPAPPPPSDAEQQRLMEERGSGSAMNPTKYVHMLLNQRTLPLGRSFKQCGDRDDGWCELDAFLEATASLYKDSEYEFACFGDYPVVPYGDVTNGVPNKKQHEAAAAAAAAVQDTR